MLVFVWRKNLKQKHTYVHINMGTTLVSSSDGIRNNLTTSNQANHLKLSPTQYYHTEDQIYST